MTQRNSQEKDNHLKEQLAAKQRELENKEYIAMLRTSTMAQAAHTIASLTDGQTDAVDVLRGMKKEILAGCKGGKDPIELMLLANAFTLDALSSSMIYKSGLQYEPESALAYMNVGLRAQDQLRKVALALDQIRRPKQQIVQNNIAGLQQVNNTFIKDQPNANIENKLDNSREAEYETRSLEPRTAGDTIQDNARFPDMVEIHRPS